MRYRPQLYTHVGLSCPASVIVVTALTVACASGGERVVQDSAAMLVDSGEMVSRRLASDATLGLLTASRLAGPLRAAADSFGVREAVSVRQQTVDTAALTALENTADILALPAELFPRVLVPTRTSWYVQFARDRMVLAYGDSSRGAATIDSSSWWRVLQRRGVRVGRVDPTKDPAGYPALLVMQLAESHYRQPKLAATLQRTSSPNMRPDESTLVAALDSNKLDYIWTRESTARASNLRYLRLPPEIDLGEPTNSTLYAEAEVVVPPVATDSVRDSLASSAGDTVRIRGAPIVYGISIMNGAPSPRHAERFLRYLFSDAGRRVLESAHLDVLPRPILSGTDIPPAIRAALGDAAISDTAAVDTTRDTAATPQRKPL